jgi:aminoglycoside phosphotransferase (APT) family kinase protein
MPAGYPARDSIGAVEDYGLAPLPGGFSGETFVAEAAGERTVVRIYAERGARRGPSAVDIDAAVLRLVRGLLPVPDVLEVRRPDPEAGTPGLLVTTFLPGERLDLLLPTLATEGRRSVGAELGAVLARLAQMPFLRAGVFVDGDLRVEPLPPELEDLVSFVESQRAGTALAEWATEDYDALRAVAARGQELLDAVDRTCLVHSDFNPKNLLVDPESLRVTGLLDWEFAYAGAPGADLGNLLRFDREPAFVEAVLGEYAARLPEDARRLGSSPSRTVELLDVARAADLYALVELTGRRGENPVTESAHQLLLAIARSGDLHAVP